MKQNKRHTKRKPTRKNAGKTRKHIRQGKLSRKHLKNKKGGNGGLIAIPQYSQGGTMITTTDFDSAVGLGRYAPRLSFGRGSTGMC